MKYIPPKQRFNLTNDKFAEFLFFIERELGWDLKYDYIDDSEAITLVSFEDNDGLISVFFDADRVIITYARTTIGKLGNINDTFAKNINLFWLTYRTDLIAITNLIKNGNNN